MYIALIFNISAGSSSLIQIDEQRSSASTSQRTDATPLVAGEETTVETTRQERTPEEDIIGILAILKRNRESTQFFFLFIFFSDNYFIHACFYVSFTY